MNDGGMMYWAQKGQHEQEERAADDCRKLEEHRQWIKNFNDGLTTTKQKNSNGQEV